MNDNPEDCQNREWLFPQKKSNPAGRISEKERLVHTSPSNFCLTYALLFAYGMIGCRALPCRAACCYSVILVLKYLPTSACMRTAASVRATG